jgi:hypothetical protein
MIVENSGPGTACRNVYINFLAAESFRIIVREHGMNGVKKKLRFPACDPEIFLRL